MTIGLVCCCQNHHHTVFFLQPPCEDPVAGADEAEVRVFIDFESLNKVREAFSLSHITCKINVKTRIRNPRSPHEYAVGFSSGPHSCYKIK